MDSTYVSSYPSKSDEKSHAATFDVHETVYNLLSCFCEEFELDVGIELACFELFDCYFENLCDDVNEQRPFWIGFTDESYAELQLKSLASDSLPDLLAIISLCAKYFGFENWKAIYSYRYPHIFSQTKLRFSPTHFYRIEYKVFRFLNFQVSAFSSDSSFVHRKEGMISISDQTVSAVSADYKIAGHHRAEARIDRYRLVCVRFGARDLLQQGRIWKNVNSPL